MREWRSKLLPQKPKAQTEKTVEVSPYQRTYTLTEKTCPVCGKTFTGQRRAVYDTGACRQKANYARHGENYRAQKQEKQQAAKKTAGKKGGEQ
jgi:hypothetical protein